MTDKKVSVTRNKRTGSYTLHLPKSAQTGKFVNGKKPAGRIVVLSKKDTA